MDIFDALRFSALQRFITAEKASCRVFGIGEQQVSTAASMAEQVGFWS